MAGCFSTLGNNPFDVVKTQMQSSGAKQRYSGTADCFVKVFREEGVAGFYKGVVPRMGRVVPGQVKMHSMKHWMWNNLSVCLLIRESFL